MGTESTRKEETTERGQSALSTLRSRATAEDGRTPHSALKWALVLLPLAYLWFRLINNLRLEWTTDPQYGYGLLVPFLCLGLLVRRWHCFRESGAIRKGLQDYGTTGLQDCETTTLQTTGQRTTGPQDQSVVRGPVVRSPIPRGLWSLVSSPWSVVLLSALLAFLYLPTRLIEAATPEWRPIQWSLGVIAIGLTLCAIQAGLGRGWLKQLAFPICFFFVAIPWPTLIEQPIIQNLTRVSAVMVTELLGWVGVPAMTHGNVIEVSTGMVGIDEACSGIRSFQTSLMISLFFGEFYRLSAGRRWLLVPLGFLFSLAFNVCRMSLLTLIAAKKGVPAISEYHDEAGITIAILCTLALWGISALMRRGTTDYRTTDYKTFKNAEILKTETLKSGDKITSSKIQAPSSKLPSPTSDLSNLRSSTTAEDGRPPISGSDPISAFQHFSISAFKTVRGLSVTLLIWLVLVESGVQLWYHVREAHLKPGPAWTLTFPQDNPTLKDIPMDEKTRYLLRFDDFKQAAWTEPDGTQWEAFYFDWLPGRVAGYLAKRHTPEICLTATGLKQLSGPELTMMNVHGLQLPIRSYAFQTPEGVIQVFHCRWEAGEQSDAYVAHESARYNLVRAVWAGRGNKGQKVLEVIISGMYDPEQAKQALASELEKLIKVEGRTTDH